jgi:hypothetical protein
VLADRGRPADPIGLVHVVGLLDRTFSTSAARKVRKLREVRWNVALHTRAVGNANDEKGGVSNVAASS